MASSISQTLLLTIALVTPLWMQKVEAAHMGIAAATALAGVLNAVLLWRQIKLQPIKQRQVG